MIEFLDNFTNLYNSGPSYSARNSSKSTLSHIVFFPIYSSNLAHPQIIKYFKCVYNLRSPIQKMPLLWDVKILSDYFSHRRQ